MKTYEVHVFRHDKWWVIEIPDVRGAHSQARHLREVELMARDVIALMLEVSEDSFDIDVHVHTPDDVQIELDHSARYRRQAADAQSQAAWHLRRATRRLRTKGLPYRDIGAVLGVSGARAKQLDAEADLPKPRTRADADNLVDA
jgi:Uncharacterized conserved protein